MADSKFEIYWVTFQNPKFGSDGKEFDPQEWQIGVSTAGGKKDAEAACKQYHKGCKVVCVATRLEVAAGADKVLKKINAEKDTKKKTKKGK